MRKQRSPCTVSSYENWSEWQISPPESCNYENEFYPTWQQLLDYDPNQIANDYQVFPQYDYNAAGDMAPPNIYLQDVNYSPMNAAESYAIYEDSQIPAESIPFSGPFVDQFYANGYAFPVEDAIPNYAEEPFQQDVLQYGMPTVTDYGTVTLLLRHLVRVDLTVDGSVSVYNFPAKSTATLNMAGNKCYVNHPNAKVYQDGPLLHLMAGNNRLAKISHRGVTFSSSSLQSLAYIVDESGTKTTACRFTDLSKDLTLDVFYDGNRRSYEDLEQESYRMVSEAFYQRSSDGNDFWILGNIRISQNRWGEVNVTQTSSQTTITTSPTIRRVTIESPSVGINIGCYSRNYLSVRKNSCSVTSGFCGLVVQNRSQKAGLDRGGRLVLF